MRKHPSSMMAVLAILMLILAACSSDGGESPSEAAESQPATSEAAEPSASEAPNQVKIRTDFAATRCARIMASDTG